MVVVHSPVVMGNVTQLPMHSKGERRMRNDGRNECYSIEGRRGVGARHPLEHFNDAAHLAAHLKSSLAKCRRAVELPARYPARVVVAEAKHGVRQEMIARFDPGTLQGKGKGEGVGKRIGFAVELKDDAKRLITERSGAGRGEDRVGLVEPLTGEKGAH